METKIPDEISKRFCQMHDNYEIIAVDLNISCNKKFLCAKCFLDMIGTKSIVLYDKAMQMIKDMKNKSDEKKSELNKIKLQNLKQLQNSTAQFEGLIKNTLSKLSDSIEHQIIENQNELETTDSQIQTVDLEEDIQILSTNYKENEEFNMPVQNIDKSKLSQFFDSIKESLIQLQSSQHFNQINQLIENIEKQLSINQDTKNKQIEEYKTPSLNQLCSKHNYQIISVNLNQIQNNENLNRLACIQCIQEVPIQYVTLNETSKRWNEFVEQQDEMKSKYQRQREFKIKTAIKFIQQLKQQYQKILTDIIQSLNDQLNQVIEDPQQIKQMDISVFLQLDEKSIQQIVNILSLKDQHHSLKTIQENTDKDYTQFQQQLISKLNNLIQQEEKLIKISNNNENVQLDESEFGSSIINFDQVTSTENSCSNDQEIVQLIGKIRQFNIYNSIFNQAINQYNEIVNSINNLSNQGNQKSMIPKNRDQQIENNKIIVDSNSNDQIQQFKQDTILIKRLLSVDQLEDELKLKKAENELISMEIEIMKREKEKITKNLEKSKEEYSLQIIKLEQQLKDKQKEKDKINDGLQFSSCLTFSQTFKHKDFMISQNAKILECTTTTTYNYGCCLCDQMIPKQGVTRFRFKIIELSNIMIGIGYKEMIQNTNYQGNYSIGKGTYSIRYCGNCWNHNQQDKNGTKIAFPYSVNDIIEVEVDIQKKYIKWTKQQTNQSFILEIDTSMDLYPCIHMEGKCKVEILK
ncbi:unnamed protein product [Paramecium pentaurelia]|uniref:SPRY domain-containing protein n=1 Tax=Paramecium pentaurelia TaxID=43138 RepID=A0A8S1VJR8_9CILI|nr:unnamed protein product [Paramecium pentaurelia]